MTDRILGLVPIKTNSKRCVNKNLRKINGKPLFWYSVDALIEAKLPSEHDYYISMGGYEYPLQQLCDYYFSRFSRPWKNFHKPANFFRRTWSYMTGTGKFMLQLFLSPDI